MKIGIQGLAASYSDAALSLLEPSAEKKLYEDFPAVFAALKAGEIDKAFLPFENSTAGFLAENFHRLGLSGLYVSEEFVHRIEHCLLAPEGTRIEDIEAVYSHPQALAQCARTLYELGIKGESWFDTAGAARDVSQLKNRAALASADAARVYGLTILKKAVNDEPENYTRFFMLERDLRWGPRILVECGVAKLMSLATADVRFVAMLTHPQPGVLWGHSVYVELEKKGDFEWKDWLSEYSGLKVLGSFQSSR